MVTVLLLRTFHYLIQHSEPVTALPFSSASEVDVVFEVQMDPSHEMRSGVST